MAKANQHKQTFFEVMSVKLTKAAGSTPVFVSSFLFIILWAASGPLLDFSEKWQLTVNTVTTIITFLMVFLIQRTQNKDSMAIQLKLNEIIASIKGASNRLVDIEDISEEDLNILKRHYTELAKLFAKEINIKESHSVEEAEKRHKEKVKK